MFRFVSVGCVCVCVLLLFVCLVFGYLPRRGEQKQSFAAPTVTRAPSNRSIGSFVVVSRRRVVTFITSGSVRSFGEA